MDLETLKGFLYGETSKDNFIVSLSEEIKGYVSDRLKNKDTTNIFVENEENIDNLTVHDLIKLLNLYLADEILEWDLEYILNALDLVDIECDDRTKEAIFYLSNSEIGVPINQKTVRRFIDYLEGESVDIKMNNLKGTLKDYRTVFN